MIKLEKDMLLQLEHLGIGIITNISQAREIQLAPENPRVDSAVLFNTYSIDILIEDKIKHVTITVVHEKGIDECRIDWGTTRDSGAVTILGTVT